MRRWQAFAQSVLGQQAAASSSRVATASRQPAAAAVGRASPRDDAFRAPPRRRLTPRAAARAPARGSTAGGRSRWRPRRPWSSTTNSRSCQGGIAEFSAMPERAAVQEVGGAHHLERQPVAPRQHQRLRHVRRLHVAEGEPHPPEAVGELLERRCRSSSATRGVVATVTVTMTLRSCSTWLCLRLCISAAGADVGVGGQEDRGAGGAGRVATSSASRSASSSETLAACALALTMRVPRTQVVISSADDAGDDQRHVAAVVQLGEVGAEEDQLDREQRHEHRQHRRTAASPRPGGTP